MRPRVIDVVGPLAALLFGAPFVVAMAGALLADDAVDAMVGRITGRRGGVR